MGIIYLILFLIVIYLLYRIFRCFGAKINAPMMVDLIFTKQGSFNYGFI